MVTIPRSTMMAMWAALSIGAILFTAWAVPLLVFQERQIGYFQQEMIVAMAKAEEVNWDAFCANLGNKTLDEYETYGPWKSTGYHTDGSIIVSCDDGIGTYTIKKDQIVLNHSN